MRSPSSETPDGVHGGYDDTDDLFTTYTLDASARRLTMIPVKYKLKEARKKVLKMSINKLKKIEDPETCLRRSVLINNTMRKLQREAREEKIQKQTTFSRTFLFKTNELIDKTNNNGTCCYLMNKNDNMFCPLSKAGDDKLCCELSKLEDEHKHSNFKIKSIKLVKLTNSADKRDELLTSTVSLNEDIVERIPSIKRCSSRKKSVDEDKSASEVLNLNESDLEMSLSCSEGIGLETSPCGSQTLQEQIDDVDDCDVSDVLSQFYMPPTPRLITTIDSDTDDEDMTQKREESTKVMSESSGKRKSDETEVMLCKKFKKDDDNRNNKENCRTKFFDDSDKVKEEEELIELEDQEDIEKRHSQSVSSRKHEKRLENSARVVSEREWEMENSCMSAVSHLCSPLQTVSFHNIIEGLES